MKTKILFICRNAQNRSIAFCDWVIESRLCITYEAIACGWEEHEYTSVQLSPELVQWADIIVNLTADIPRTLFTKVGGWGYKKKIVHFPIEDSEHKETLMREKFEEFRDKYLLEENK